MTETKQQCSRCDKEAIGAAVDYFNTNEIVYYCQDHFDDVAYIKVDKEDE